MIYMLMGYAHAAIERRVRGRSAPWPRASAGRARSSSVWPILLVSLLMVGMVAAMKGFNGKQGTELAGVIVDKIKQAVDKVAFK